MAGQIDRSGVFLDNLRGGSKSDASPLDAAENICAAAKTLEHVRQVTGRNADAWISDTEHGRTRLAVNADGDLTTGGAVLDGIREQVVEDALQAALVPRSHQRCLAGIDDDGVFFGG